MCMYRPQSKRIDVPCKTGRFEHDTVAMEAEGSLHRSQMDHGSVNILTLDSSLDKLPGTKTVVSEV